MKLIQSEKAFRINVERLYKTDVAYLVLKKVVCIFVTYPPSELLIFLHLHRRESLAPVWRGVLDEEEEETLFTN